MMRLLSLAAIACMLLLSQSGHSYAAGPYDGEWTGSATATSGRCRPAVVTLTVAGRVVTGEARFEVEAQNINGTVQENGTFGATLGFHQLTGRFTRDAFDGSFTRADCVWRMQLKRTR